MELAILRLEAIAYEDNPIQHLISRLDSDNQGVSQSDTKPLIICARYFSSGVVATSIFSCQVLLIAL